MTTHKLRSRCLPNGVTRWTCECGAWKPDPAPRGLRWAPIDSVLSYIQRAHEKHAIEAAHGIKVGA